MGGLKPVSWRIFDSFLFLHGCNFVRERGDHRIYWKAGLQRPLVIPKVKDIPIFIIRNNLRMLGISVEEYLKFLAQ